MNGEKRRQNEELFRLLAENAHDVIWTIDLDLNIVYVSPSIKTVTGYTMEETLARKLSDIMPPASFEAAMRVLGEKMELEKKNGKDMSGQRTLELEFLRKDGTTIWMEVKGDHFRDSNGQAIGFTGISRDITERKATEAKLRIYQRQLRSLASELSLSEERERRRIAVELHDGIGQSLIFSKMKLMILREAAAKTGLSSPFQEICETLDQVIQNARDLTFDLSSPILYEMGFEAAISEWLTDQVEKRHGIATKFVDDGLYKPLDEDIRVLLFKAVRELLNNVVMHARARTVKVTVQKDGKDIKVLVEDDGIGFSFSPARGQGKETGGFGLFSIGERLDHLGGHMVVDSEPGKGTRVSLVAPLKAGN